MLLALALALAIPPPAPASLPGRWYPDLSSDPITTIDRLESLGYVTGSAPAPAHTGVVVWDRARAVAGVSLYNSGHAATASLIAMDGKVLHTWAKPFSAAFPAVTSNDPEATGTWRRVALRPADGHLLAIFEGLGLVHLDRQSRIVWATANRAHHDARWRPDGGVLVLTRVPRPDRGPPGHPLLEDFVTELDDEGQVVRRVSVLAALARSPWAHLLDRAPPDTGDILHTNALFPLDDVHDDSGFTGPGRVLLSMRHIGALAVLDLDQQRILWATTGDWSRQHDVEITPTGALMMFDNRGATRGMSRVLALEPWTTKLRWSYAGSPEHPLVSEVLGAAQELPNGSVLVTESTRGRVVEVTRGGEVVWEYRNPERAGPNDVYIAAIFEMIRYPLAAVRSWLG